MKINNIDVEKPDDLELIIPKGDVIYHFKAQAVLDDDDFLSLCPQPQPPSIQRPGQNATINPEDPEYKKEMDQWAEQKTAWLILKSLEATDGLEWDTVEMSDPETWKNYMKDLESNYFSKLEILRIVQLTTAANGLDQRKIDEAMTSFLAGRGQELES